MSQGFVLPQDATRLTEEGPPTAYKETRAEERARVGANVASLNAKAAVRNTISRLATDDPIIGWVRLVTLVVMGAATLGGTISVIWGIATSADLLTIVVSAGVVALGLIYAGLVNPLQTIERDMVFRRWSDMIVTVYLDELADNEKSETAGSSANERFTALATSYSALSTKSGDVLTALASSAGAKPPEPTQISIDNPGTQTVVAESKIDGFAITAKGPGELTYESNNLPSTLNLDGKTGKVTGTAPKDAGDHEVTVTVASDKKGTGSAAVTFTVTVTAKPDPAKTKDGGTTQN